ncbi:hypothetical protein [Nostoc sp.]|uniref:hypothetical protein n=1 Tax=Nostoc sp. TaxID=1180 RepID=UPI002FFAC658
MQPQHDVRVRCCASLGVNFRLVSRKRLHIIGGERIATHSPVAALDLFNHNPRH